MNQAATASIKAIETTYSGIRFRSRLEARWATFFDACNIAWKYEEQGFEVPSKTGKTLRYLPDFFLPESGEYVEVKGSKSALWEDAEKLEAFVSEGKKTLVVLGDVPDATAASLILHHYYQPSGRDGLDIERSVGWFSSVSGCFVTNAITMHWAAACLLYPASITRDQLMYLGIPQCYVRRENGIVLPDAKVEGFWLNESLVINGIWHMPQTRKAYVEARQKRFEFVD